MFHLIYGIGWSDINKRAYIYIPAVLTSLASPRVIHTTPSGHGRRNAAKQR